MTCNLEGCAQYGLSVEEYDAIIARGCAICGSHERVHLDHDHTTGKVRDALCQRHNLMLGHAHDDPGELRAGARYAEDHSLIHLPLERDYAVGL